MPENYFKWVEGILYIRAYASLKKYKKVQEEKNKAASSFIDGFAYSKNCNENNGACARVLFYETELARLEKAVELKYQGWKYFKLYTIADRGWREWIQRGRAI